MGTLAEAAAVPAFRIAFAWLAILAEPAWEPAANTLVNRPAWSAAAPYWLSDKVSESTASFRVMSLAAACNRMASSVTALSASLSPSSSGLAEPTSMNASRISAADWRTRKPSFVMVVESVLACPVNQQKYGLGCIGCAAAHFENLEAGAKVHGFDPDAMVDDINALIED